MRKTILIYSLRPRDQIIRGELLYVYIYKYLTCMRSHGSVLLSVRIICNWKRALHAFEMNVNYNIGNIKRKSFQKLMQQTRLRLHIFEETRRNNFANEYNFDKLSESFN